MSEVFTPTPAWQEQVFKVLKEGGIQQVSYVPDAGHAHVIRRVNEDPAMRAIVLTTEEEGVAVAGGAWLGGQRHALQSCRFPFLTLVTMRGEYAEFNPWQVPMSKATQASMELMGIKVYRAERADEVEDVVGAALDFAFEGGEPVAVLLSQRLIGRKKWLRH
jgi:sulfopyruvate decarboxylase TPP-binding subunit